VATNSDKTVTDIVADANATPEPTDEFDEEAIEGATPIEAPSTNALKYVSAESAAFYPTIQKAREAAEIPEHISVKDLVGKPILFATKTAQKAALPDTGELRDGFFCACLFIETKQPFTTWVGQTALVRDLSQVQVPFQTTIVKHGRTYRFE